MGKKKRVRKTHEWGGSIPLLESVRSNQERMGELVERQRYTLPFPGDPHDFYLGCFPQVVAEAIGGGEAERLRNLKHMLYYPALGSADRVQVTLPGIDIGLWIFLGPSTAQVPCQTADNYDLLCPLDNPGLARVLNWLRLALTLETDIGIQLQLIARMCHHTRHASLQAVVAAADLPAVQRLGLDMVDMAEFRKLQHALVTAQMLPESFPVMAWPKYSAVGVYEPLNSTEVQS